MNQAELEMLLVTAVSRQNASDIHLTFRVPHSSPLA
jgi:hypothetical protein